MNTQPLLPLLFILLAISSVHCETNETVTNITSESVPEISEKDILIAELKVLQDQIAINQKKLQLLEGIRSVSLDGNQTLTQIDTTVLEETIALQNTYQQQSDLKPQPGSLKPQYNIGKDRGESLNLMNKILKKITIELAESIVQVNFLPLKPTQKNSDEPAIQTLVVFLTKSNSILIYELSGALVLAYEPGHQVKSFAPNVLTDEYYIATLGTDNTIRMHNLLVNKVKIDDGSEPSQKPSKNSRFTLEYQIKVEYVFDLEHGATIPESICQEICSKRTEKKFHGLAQILNRNNKFTAIHNGENDLLVIHRNGTIRGSYTLPGGKFISIQKFFPNPIFATTSTVGFFSPLGLEVTAPHCDNPGAPIVKVDVDLYSSNHFSVLLENGEVLFYEIKQNSCKAVAKKMAPIGEAASLFSGKNFAFMQYDKKGINIGAFNITDTLYNGSGDIEHFNISLYPFKTDQDQVSKGHYIATRSTHFATLIGASYDFENSTSAFTLYEMTIMSKPPSDWFDNIRIYIIVGVVVAVVGYQFFFKKGKKTPPRRVHSHRPGEACEEDHDHSQQYGRGSKGGLKKNLDINDMDSLQRELERLEAMKAQSGGFKGSSKSSASTKRVSFSQRDEYEEDDYSYERDSRTKKNL